MSGQKIPIDLFDPENLDTQYQFREKNDSDRITFLMEDMLDRIEEGKEPLKVPIKVAVINLNGIVKYVIVDGFHRFNAVLQLNDKQPMYAMSQIDIEIVANTHQEALLYAFKANSTHEGLPRKRGDSLKVATGAALYLYENRGENTWKINPEEVQSLASVGLNIAKLSVREYNIELKEALREQVSCLLSEGLPIRAIGEKLNISKSQAGRFKEELEDLGCPKKFNKVDLGQTIEGKEVSLTGEIPLNSGELLNKPKANTNPLIDKYKEEFGKLKPPKLPDNRYKEENNNEVSVDYPQVINKLLDSLHTLCLEYQNLSPHMDSHRAMMISGV